MFAYNTTKNVWIKDAKFELHNGEWYIWHSERKNSVGFVDKYEKEKIMKIVSEHPEIDFNLDDIELSEERKKYYDEILFGDNIQCGYCGKKIKIGKNFIKYLEQLEHFALMNVCVMDF